MADREKSAGRILIVDDEADLATGLRLVLKRRGFSVETSGLAEDALKRLQEEPVDLVLTDLMLPGMSGLELLERVKEAWPETFVVLFTGFATVETAVQAIQKGAFDYISKPFTPQQLGVVVNRVFQHKALADENRHLKGQIQDRFSFDCLIGLSEPMKRINALLARVAAIDANVLIVGESGTGKELVARAIHANSRRANKPFVPLDCAALPFNLLESELFGFEKGAFTGAISTKPGLLEAADRGTFFMDEIGELESSTQVKFLRVLQERQFRRVGGNRTISVDVRFVAATNRDLETEARAGRFREDLYHRLNVIQVHLPPLRARQGDISLLAHHFINGFALRLGKTGMRLLPEGLQALESYDWPGNVRELQNAMEYAVSLSEGPQLGVADLPPSIQKAYEASGAGGGGSSDSDGLQTVGGGLIEVHHELPYKQAKRRWLEAFERTYFSELLRRHSFNISHAAIAAEIDRKSIQRILKKNNLDVGQLLEGEADSESDM